jgi:hypothetical protein
MQKYKPEEESQGGKGSRVKLGIFEAAKRESIRTIIVAIRVHEGRTQAQTTSVSAIRTRRPVVAVAIGALTVDRR